MPYGTARWGASNYPAKRPAEEIVFLRRPWRTFFIAWLVVCALLLIATSFIQY
jgi:hypothetical protein